jgi:putative SOS response-associated peptidase YedK
MVVIRIVSVPVVAVTEVAVTEVAITVAVNPIKAVTVDVAATKAAEREPVATEAMEATKAVATEPMETAETMATATETMAATTAATTAAGDAGHGEADLPLHAGFAPRCARAPLACSARTLTSGTMCGRIIQSSRPLRYAFVDGMNVRDSRVHNYAAVERGAEPGPAGHPAQPSERGNLSRSVALGLIPHWCKDPSGGRKPINAKCETVRNLPTFRDAYRMRRCIVPVDGFFEWKAIKGQKAKQPYAIAMKDGKPFGIGGIWENWKEPASGEWMRTFAVITTDANELVADIHDRMPLILAPEGYGRWLGDEPDPRDLMRPFRAGLMRMWPISTRVNKPGNDDASIVEPRRASPAFSRGRGPRGAPWNDLRSRSSILSSFGGQHD